MRTLTIEDLNDLALGAAVLGSGGGGDPAYDLLMAKQAFERFGPVDLIDAEDLSDEDLVVPVGFMGAPLVTREKLPSGREFLAIIEAITKFYGKRPAALMATEIGGGNAFAPLLIAGKLGLPVVDADTIGRAFPELQMSTCNLFGISSNPAFLADANGQCVTLNVFDSLSVEKYARAITVAMGSSAAIGFYLMKGREVIDATVKGSVSLAIELGRAIRIAKEEPHLSLLEVSKGRHLASGMIDDVAQEVKDGFLEGTFTIGDVVVTYQNEYLLVRQGEQILAVTPEIIIPLEQESGIPITSESLRYGLRVELLALPAPQVWMTKEGLQLVGPEVFGYV
jgi:DUF917 family protein